MPDTTKHVRCSSNNSCRRSALFHITSISGLEWNACMQHWQAWRQVGWGTWSELYPAAEGQGNG